MMDFPGDVNTAMAIYFYRKEAAFLAALGCVVHKKQGARMHIRAPCKPEGFD